MLADCWSASTLLTNERSIFSTSHRHLTQARQRRVPGAEVVDRDPQASTVQVPEDLLRTVGIHHGRGLRDLDQHVRRIDAAIDDASEDPLREVGLPELPRREVEPDLEVDVELAPGLRLVHELPHHPVTDQLDQAELLGERDELVRGHHRAVGLDPADQRLDADHASRLEFDDGLVVERPPLTVDRLAETGHELQLRTRIERAS